MGEFDCTVTPSYDGAGFISGFCVDCPEIPAIVGVPTQVITDNRVGWNASAYSAVARVGDCYTEFNVPAGAIGVVCGFANARVSNSPLDVPHAFACFRQAGGEYWAVCERGVYKTTPVLRAPSTDTFRIERRGSDVRYFFNGKTCYVSTAPSPGELVVVACMYSATDGVN